MLRLSKLSGDEIWKNKTEKIVISIVYLKDAELFILTYGSLVAQLVKDLEEPGLINKQLDKMFFIIMLI
jgi:trafficking protein particle complex subunit 3